MIIMMVVSPGDITDVFTAQKRSFSLRVFSVNVTKSAGNCFFNFLLTIALHQGQIWAFIDGHHRVCASFMPTVYRFKCNA